MRIIGRYREGSIYLRTLAHQDQNKGINPSEEGLFFGNCYRVVSLSYPIKILVQ